MKAGDYLYASCSAVLFARVLDVSETACTIRLFDPSELDLDAGSSVITVGINDVYPDPKEAHEDERGSWTGEIVILDTPGDGCFRCTKMFSILDRPDLAARFWDHYCPEAIAAARSEATELRQ